MSEAKDSVQNTKQTCQLFNENTAGNLQEDTEGWKKVAWIFSNKDSIQDSKTRRPSEVSRSDGYRWSVEIKKEERKTEEDHWLKS